MKVGAIPIRGPNLLDAEAHAYRFDQTGATAAITDEAGAAKVDAAVPAGDMHGPTPVGPADSD